MRATADLRRGVRESLKSSGNKRADREAETIMQAMR